MADLIRYIADRLLHFLLVYLLASGALFIAIKLIPEDPIVAKYEKYPDPERIAKERAARGLDQPLLDQYIRYNREFLTGDWGKSLIENKFITEEFFRVFPATIELALAAMIIGALVGSSSALYARVSGRPIARQFALSFGAIGLTVPIFWLGLVALILGSSLLGFFPSGDRFSYLYRSPDSITGLLLLDSLLQGDFQSFGIALHHITLPACCLAVFPAASVSSVLYARLNEPAVNALYTSLKARGFGVLRIVFVHMLRVAGAPVVTVLGTTFGALLGGAFLTETVFSWPGMGRYLVDAIVNRDIFVAQFVLLFIIVLVYAVAFVSDIVSRELDVVSKDREGRSLG